MKVLKPMSSGFGLKTVKKLGFLSNIRGNQAQKTLGLSVCFFAENETEAKGKTVLNLAYFISVRPYDKSKIWQGILKS
jgi:hypothetical protein